MIIKLHIEKVWFGTCDSCHLFFIFILILAAVEQQEPLTIHDIWEFDGATKGTDYSSERKVTKSEYSSS